MANDEACRMSLVAALASLAVCLMLSIYGAHDRLGFFAGYAGYPGRFINWKLNPGRVSYALIALVNPAVYFGILQVLGLLVGKRPSKGCRARITYLISPLRKWPPPLQAEAAAAGPSIRMA
jgi:hypothetical protein